MQCGLRLLCAPVAASGGSGARRCAASARRAAPSAPSRRRRAGSCQARASLREALLASLWRALDGPPPPPDPASLVLSAPDATQLPSAPGLALATFAGGCFWGLEAALAATPGVCSTLAGYSGGREQAPSYARVASGRSGHVEAVRCEYDARAVPYEALLACWWSALADAADARGQGQDRGPQYRPGVFWHDASQRDQAACFLQQKQAERGARPLAVLLKPAAPFYPAEEVHQQYLAKGGLDPDPEVPFWMGAFVD